jgi:hypothetical protein
MKERPILFSAPMVRAILEGRKTMTRRIIKDPICTNREIYGEDGGLTWYGNFGLRKPCKFGAVGDRLWVKETWCPGYDHDPDDLSGDPKVSVIYNADQQTKYITAPSYELADDWSRNYSEDGDDNWKLKPSIFMPRWASRIMLEIVSVRVERLQDITEEDAKAEGVIHDDCSTVLWKNYTNKMSSYDTARSSYASLWEKINGDGSWDSNPWVWVIEFKRVTEEQKGGE